MDRSLSSLVPPAMPHCSGFASVRGWSAAACLSPSALNAATFHSEGWLSPGEFITLTGYAIGPDVGIAYEPDAQGQPPRQLAGVQVFFDGQPAPILYAQSRQVNVLAPFELNGKTYFGPPSAGPDTSILGVRPKNI